MEEKWKSWEENLNYKASRFWSKRKGGNSRLELVILCFEQVMWKRNGD
jgi:hypothetical protein